MIKLNDYLYDVNTVIKILFRYAQDLQEHAQNEIDLLHANFLLQIADTLQHNDFLTAQSQKLRDFYKFMASEYPFLSFTFKGRIKSLIRAEEKFNGYIVEYVYDEYSKNHEIPKMDHLKKKLSCFRDLIAYRIVVSLPKCHLLPGMNQEEEETKYLFQIANHLIKFMEERGFNPELAPIQKKKSNLLLKEVQPYYRDYISNINPSGYQALHITFYDTVANSYIEVQLRTKQMDDLAEIGKANHISYEKLQEELRARRNLIPLGLCSIFDDAYERGMALQQLDLSSVDVNMFGAINNSLVNDGCGLYRGRLILPYEHLSRFQNDMID